MAPKPERTLGGFHGARENYCTWLPLPLKELRDIKKTRKEIGRIIIEYAVHIYLLAINISYGCALEEHAGKSICLSSPPGS
jgi:hypothetical protein